MNWLQSFYSILRKKVNYFLFIFFLVTCLPSNSYGAEGKCGGKKYSEWVFYKEEKDIGFLWVDSEKTFFIYKFNVQDKYKLFIPSIIRNPSDHVEIGIRWEINF